MFKTIKTLADKYEYHGWKRVLYFIISPPIYVVSWIYGYGMAWKLSKTGKL